MLIKNAKIIDGNRNKPYEGSLIYQDDKIEKIVLNNKKIENYQGPTIDAKGRYLTPAFIDMHSHGEFGPIIFDNADSKIWQGIGTEVVGNCGSSTYPLNLDEYLNQSTLVEFKEKFEGKEKIFKDFDSYKILQEDIGLYTNQVSLVGHNSLRSKVNGNEDRRPTDREMDLMCKILDELLNQGAGGLSLGLTYAPGSFSDTEELISLAKVVKDHNKILTAHIRDEGDHIFEAIDEMIEIARKSGVRVLVSHFKIMSKRQWNRAQELTEKIESARDEGIEIYADQYPYTATSTRLIAVIPSWANGGDKGKILDRLKNPTDKLIKEIEYRVQGRGGYENIVISSTSGYKEEYIGRTLANIARDKNMSNIDNLLEILVETDLNARTNYFSVDEDDMDHIMKKMYVGIGSDGWALSTDKKFNNNNFHPRHFGSFPEFFARIRDKDLMPIEDGVYKATSLPARVFGLKDQGQIKEGYKANLVMFYYENMDGNSCYMNSTAKAKGIDYLIVNGQMVIDQGQQNDAKPGKVIRS